jgi:hypothetical protein
MDKRPPPHIHPSLEGSVYSAVLAQKGARLLLRSTCADAQCFRIQERLLSANFGAVRTGRSTAEEGSVVVSVKTMRQIQPMNTPDHSDPPVLAMSYPARKNCQTSLIRAALILIRGTTKIKRRLMTFLCQ